MTLTDNAQQRIDPATVTGWGVDADPENDPTYPYRLRGSEPGVLHAQWDAPSRQETDLEILQSNEYVRRPAVFGTSVPPRGVSGMLRRLAFRYSESDWRHWLILLGADRVDCAEGLVRDIGRGRIPNIPAEMGMGAEWKHDRGAVIRKVAIVGAVSLIAVALLRRRR